MKTTIRLSKTVACACIIELASFLCCEAALADVMPPAPLPEYTPGDVYTYSEGGKISHSVVDSIDGDLVWFNEPGTGARWSYFRNFALPTPHWDSSTATPGSQYFIGDIEDFFPLRIGNIMEFMVEGEDKSTGNVWNYTTTCEVTGNEAVTVQAGVYDTYRVDCVSNKWGWEKIYFYAPKEQLLVRLISRSEGAPDSVQDLVSYKKR